LGGDLALVIFPLAAWLVSIVVGFRFSVRAYRRALSAQQISN
jgi:hypothetical protein